MGNGGAGATRLAHIFNESTRNFIIFWIQVELFHNPFIY